mgnify:CR=1 FL=1
MEKEIQHGYKALWEVTVLREHLVADGDAAFAYDLALATNVVTGTALIGLLSAHNITTAAGNAYTAAGAVSTNTLLKMIPPSGGADADVVRLTFLYR